MKNLILAFVMVLVSNFAIGQSVIMLDDNGKETGNYIEQMNDINESNAVLVHVKMTYKSATTLIVNQLQTRSNSQFYGPDGKKWEVTYSDKTYTFQGTDYPNKSEVKKAVKEAIRKSFLEANK
jgi:hypothetical protein